MPKGATVTHIARTLSQGQDVSRSFANRPPTQRVPRLTGQGAQIPLAPQGQDTREGPGARIRMALARPILRTHMACQVPLFMPRDAERISASRLPGHARSACQGLWSNSR
jgi:hypothetical protein